MFPWEFCDGFCVKARSTFGTDTLLSFHRRNLSSAIDADGSKFENNEEILEVAN